MNNLLSAKGLAKATVAYTLLTLVIRVGALDAPVAGVNEVTRAIRTLGFGIRRPSALGRGACLLVQASFQRKSWNRTPQVGFFGCCWHQ